MSNPISIVLVGIGGYGNRFVDVLLDAPNQGDFTLAGTIDPSPSTCKRINDLRARGVPHYPSLEAFYEVGAAELAVISSPLQFHALQTCLALENGSHVLCEKPLCATPDQSREMIRARDVAQRHVAIGYQWAFSPAVQQLKADILSGLLGRPKRLRGLVLWPRDESYYSRNRWVGAIKDAQGHFILDSPVSNACAHHLHNMLYILGSRIDLSGIPARINAELYRANAIQNYDTAALRIQTTEGVELLFIASHATANLRGPLLHYEFERATVNYDDGPGAKITARFTDGSVKEYGSPTENRDRKLWDTIAAIRAGQPSICGIEAASAHTQCVWAAQQGEIVDFPKSLIEVSGQPGQRKTTVTGLDEALTRSYETWKLLGEMGFSWSRPARDIVIAGVVA